MKQCPCSFLKSFFEDGLQLQALLTFQYCLFFVRQYFRFLPIPFSLWISPQVVWHDRTVSRDGMLPGNARTPEHTWPRAPVQTMLYPALLAKHVRMQTQILMNAAGRCRGEEALSILFYVCLRVPIPSTSMHHGSNEICVRHCMWSVFANRSFVTIVCSVVQFVVFW